ncbi:MAG: VWA domain-containing protein, partial [Planctomycetes bacterium]|nr:VWA domain-containing protein [Planctomycetota bacterium]
GARRAEIALTTRAPAPIEPGDVQIVAGGPLRVGRPARFAVRLADTVPSSASTRVTIRPSGGGDPVLESERLEFEGEFERAGEYVVEFAATCDGVTLRGRGSVSVAPAPMVGVVGKASGPLVDALRVQGVEAVATDLRRLAQIDALIVLDPLDPSEQARLVEFVDGGGGLFVVGGQRGGALPGRGEPLHVWMPVEVLERPPPTDEPTAVPEDVPDQPPEPPDGLESPDTDEPVTGLVEPADVDPNAPPTEVERRHVSLVIVLDQSGSMSVDVVDGATRLDFAKRSAYETLAQLEPDDRIGIVGFDDRAREILPMRARPSLVELERALEKVGATMGGTRIAAGLERAGEWLRAEHSAVRHAVVLTDADRQGIDPGDIRRARVLATRLHRSGITVSVLHISAPGDDVRVATIAEIAELGGGRLHRAEDASRVPRLLVAEVQRVLGELGRREPLDPSVEHPAEPESTENPPDDASPPPELPVEPDAPPPEDGAMRRLEVRAIRDSALVEPVPANGFPAVAGISEVVGRPHALTLLVAGDDGVPLLAFANRGLGRIGVWSSDLTGGWGARWLAAPEFPARLAQWISFLLPAETASSPPPIGEEAVLDPPAPTRGERAELERLAGSPILPIADYEVPKARRVLETERRGDDDALLAFATLLLLAIVEFVARRI